MKRFTIQQLEFMKELGDVLNFSYDLDVINYHAKRNFKKLIKCAEHFYSHQIENIANNIKARKAKIVLLAGPSSCGKTTSSIRIKKELAKLKIKARVISMDDFFVNKVDTPLLPDGTYDFENVTAVDIPTFKKFLKDILSKNSAVLPKYDFVSGTRCENKRIKISDDEVLLIEGIHALNPLFLKAIEKKRIFKIYISVSSNFIHGSEVIITSKKLRLMRRMLRDYYKRKTSIQNTLEWWKKVRIGESAYILPYRTTADVILNTTHLFEPLLYDTYLRPLLEKEPESEEINELLEIFKKTGRMTKEDLPKSSLAWEFLPSDIDISDN